MDSGLARTIVENEAEHVFATPSLVSKPQLRWSSQGGIGAAIAEATGLQTVAYAVQAQFGFQPDDYRLALFSEDGLVKVLITGQSRRTASGYSQVVVQDPGESVVDLIRRATLDGVAHIDPYLTALYQLAQQNAAGENADAERIIAAAMPRFADTPRNPQRALFENLQGLLALLRQDAGGGARRPSPRRSPPIPTTSPPR